MSVCGTTLDCRSTDVQADVTNCWTAPRHLGDERGRCNVPPPRLAFSRWRLRPSWTVDGPHERRDDPFSPDQQVQRRSPPGGCRRGGRRPVGKSHGHALPDPQRMPPKGLPPHGAEPTAGREAARPFSCRLPVDHRRARREGHVHPFARDVTPVGAQIHEYAVPRCPVPWRQGQVQRAGSVWRCPMGVRRGGHREAHGWRHHRSYD